MNPASKSIIPKTFSHLKVVVKVVEAVKPKRPTNPLTKNELELLVSLRALKVPFKDCARRMERTHGSCRRAVQNLNLYAAIEAKRIEIINGVVNG
jgi:hypothetical protein